jgi:preprotein translocase subunit YajC
MDPLFLSLLFIAVLVLPLILNTRRQKRAMAQAQRLQESLTTGDRVMTTSGLHGTVVGSENKTTVDLEIAPGVRTTWLRAAIREKIVDHPAELDHDGTAAATAQPPSSPEEGAHAESS